MAAKNPRYVAAKWSVLTAAQKRKIGKAVNNYTEDGMTEYGFEKVQLPATELLESMYPATIAVERGYLVVKPEFTGPFRRAKNGRMVPAVSARTLKRMLVEVRMAPMDVPDVNAKMESEGLRAIRITDPTLVIRVRSDWAGRLLRGGSR